MKTMKVPGRMVWIGDDTKRQKTERRSGWVARCSQKSLVFTLQDIILKMWVLYPLTT